MNYKVLYRKYRPDSFEGLIGQNHVVSILKNSIKEQKIAHAYLFSGPRGTGKTSTARILAKAINCLDNHNGIACENCDNCLSFNSNPDIIEIDAASNNGVDEIRELINNVKIMPTSLKYKVYIIDEVHMLSQSAFNALLLTLEEPPEHVIFILATTNLESVPITIVSRCQRFEFKRIGDNEILDRLKGVCEKETIKYDEDGLKEIAVLADGGLRDALSILDQLSKNDELITADLVAKEIGTISNQKIYDLITALDNSDIDVIDAIFKEFQSTNLNYKVVIKKIIYALSEIGVEILKDNTIYKMDYDTVKNLVMDLNNLINKININVDAYLLIKMTFLGYVTLPKKVNNNLDNEAKTKDVFPIPEEKKVEVEQKIEVNDVSDIIRTTLDDLNNFDDRLIDIRINNCFVEASKSYLVDIKAKWEDFVKNVDSALIKGLVSDTAVVTASNKYAILVTTINHKELEINKKIDEIKKMFDDFINGNYTLVFINEAKWLTEKKKYIDNLQKKYEYKYIEEKIEENQDTSNDDISAMAEVFDIDKIEIE